MRYLLPALIALAACTDQLPSDPTDIPPHGYGGAGGLVQNLELPGWPGSHKWLTTVTPRVGEVPYFLAVKLVAAAMTGNADPNYFCTANLDAAYCTQPPPSSPMYPVLWADKDPSNSVPGNGQCYTGNYDYTSYMVYQCTSGPECRTEAMTPHGSKPPGFYPALAVKFKTVCHSSGQPNGPLLVNGSNIQVPQSLPKPLQTNLFRAWDALLPCPSGGCTW